MLTLASFAVGLAALASFARVPPTASPRRRAAADALRTLGRRTNDGSIARPAAALAPLDRARRIFQSPNRGAALTSRDLAQTPATPPRGPGRSESRSSRAQPSR